MYIMSPCTVSIISSDSAQARIPSTHFSIKICQYKISRSCSTQTHGHTCRQADRHDGSRQPLFTTEDHHNNDRATQHPDLRERFVQSGSSWNWVYVWSTVYTGTDRRQSSWKQDSNKPEPDRPQHNHSADCVVAQQYFSTTFVSLSFDSLKGNFGVRFENVTVICLLL
jgi:hypothetical protein